MYGICNCTAPKKKKSTDTEEYYQTLSGELTKFYILTQKTEVEESFPYSIYEICITLILNPNRHNTQKDYRQLPLVNLGAKSPQPLMRSSIENGREV